MKQKKIDLAFEPGEMVWIPDLQAKARVTCIYVSLYGITYNVTYFINGDQKTANLVETEIARNKS